MPEQPIPEQDPLVNKSYATWYVVSMALLMVTLFWALWDEDYGQRPSMEGVSTCLADPLSRAAEQGKPEVRG